MGDEAKQARTLGNVAIVGAGIPGCGFLIYIPLERRETCMFHDAQYLTENEKAALAEIKRRVSVLFGVRQYVLFGSKARGDAEPDSDIDLLIVTKRALSCKEKECITHEILDVNLPYDTNFAATVVDAETWDSALWRIVPLHRNVMNEGVVV